MEGNLSPGWTDCSEFICGNDMGTIGVGLPTSFKAGALSDIGEERSGWETLALVGSTHVCVERGSATCASDPLVEPGAKCPTPFAPYIGDTRLFWAVTDADAIWALRLCWSSATRASGDGPVNLERRRWASMTTLVSWLLLTAGCCTCGPNAEAKLCGLVSNWVHKGVVRLTSSNEAVKAFLRRASLSKTGALNWGRDVVPVSGYGQIITYNKYSWGPNLQWMLRLRNM